MLGFSLQKLIFTVALVLIVWYAFKFIGRLDQKRKTQLKAARRRAKAPRAEAPDADAEAEDMVACPTCGVYVSAHGAKSCGKPRCPYPG